MSNKDSVIGIDLFAGAGGMTLAASQAGVRIVSAVERCPYAAATYRMNFPSVALHVGDIRKVRSLPAKPKSARTIMFGGPPCQGFSTSNQRTRSAHNPSNWLFKEFIRLVLLWKPDWVVMENVKGIIETENGRFFYSAVNALKRAGYETTFGLLNAIDFGVPQKRTRAFIVGSRYGDKYEFPRPSNEPPLAVLDAIRDLPHLLNGAAVDELPYGSDEPSRYASGLRDGGGSVTGNLVTRNAPQILERYRHVPPGGNWSDIPPRLLSGYANIERCHTGIYRRLHPAEPSVVIGNYRKNMLIHPVQDRGLSVREAARIQSIPDSFRFSGSIGFQQQQVGNMVPPGLGRAVFRALLDT